MNTTPYSPKLAIALTVMSKSSAITWHHQFLSELENEDEQFLGLTDERRVKKALMALIADRCGLAGDDASRALFLYRRSCSSGVY
jgi:hypothetical protein